MGAKGECGRAGSSTGNVLQPLYRAALLRDGAGLSDGELLEGFVP